MQFKALNWSTTNGYLYLWMRDNKTEYGKRNISVYFKNFLVLAEIFHPGGVLVVTLIYMTEEDIWRQNQYCYIFKCNALHWWALMLILTHLAGSFLPHWLQKAALLIPTPPALFFSRMYSLCITMHWVGGIRQVHLKHCIIMYCTCHLMHSSWLKFDIAVPSLGPTLFFSMM